MYQCRKCHYIHSGPGVCTRSGCKGAPIEQIPQPPDSEVRTRNYFIDGVRHNLSIIPADRIPTIRDLMDTIDAHVALGYTVSTTEVSRDGPYRHYPFTWDIPIKRPEEMGLFPASFEPLPTEAEHATLANPEHYVPLTLSVGGVPFNQDEDLSFKVSEPVSLALDLKLSPEDNMALDAMFEAMDVKWAGIVKVVETKLHLAICDGLNTIAKNYLGITRGESLTPIWGWDYYEQLKLWMTLESDESLRNRCYAEVHKLLKG